MTHHVPSGMRAHLLYAIALSAALVILASCSRKETADERFAAIYTAEWKWREEQFPDDEDSQKPIQDHLPKVDPDSQAGAPAHVAGHAAKLDAIAREELSPAERVNYDVYRPQIETLIANQQFRDYEMPANSDTTFWTDLGYTARRPFRDAQDYRNWIAQMRDIPRYFREQIDEMRRGLKRGFTPPRVTMTGRDASITAVTDASPEAEPLLYAVQGHARSRGGRPGRAPGTGGCRHPRFGAAGIPGPAGFHAQRISSGHCAPRLAAYDLPDGKAYYRAKIREYTTLDMDPDAIHAFGESEVARLHGEMLDVMKRDGIQGRLSGVPRVPARRSRSFRQKLRPGSADARGLDRQEVRRQGLAILRAPAARPLHHQAGARRLAPFYTAGPRRPGAVSCSTPTICRAARSTISPR